MINAAIKITVVTVHLLPLQIACYIVVKPGCVICTDHHMLIAFFRYSNRCDDGMVGCAVVIGSGVILRDSHGVAQVRHVTGNKILRILKAQGLAPNIPEDLYCLIKKAVSIRKHLERNRKVWMDEWHHACF